jgi:uncharacterized membrane protein
MKQNDGSHDRDKLIVKNTRAGIFAVSSILLLVVAGIWLFKFNNSDRTSLNVLGFDLTGFDIFTTLIVISIIIIIILIVRIFKTIRMKKENY